MKKLFLVLVFFALSNCEIKVRDSNAGNQKCGDLNTYCLNDQVSYTDFVNNGMHYRIYESGPRGEIFLINITKDKLEVEKLKEEIKYFRNQNRIFDSQN